MLLQKIWIFKENNRQDDKKTNCVICEENFIKIKFNAMSVKVRLMKIMRTLKKAW